jgi:hypothetical protein
MQWRGTSPTLPDRHAAATSHRSERMPEHPHTATRRACFVLLVPLEARPIPSAFRRLRLFGKRFLCAVRLPFDVPLDMYRTGFS